MVIKITGAQMANNGTDAAGQSPASHLVVWREEISRVRRPETTHPRALRFFFLLPG